MLKPILIKRRNKIPANEIQLFKHCVLQALKNPPLTAGLRFYQAELDH